MIKFKTILFYIFLTILFRNVQAQSIPQNVHGIKLIFMADSASQLIPNELITQLNTVPVSELDDAIITYLVDTELYQNVNVRNVIDQKNNENIFSLF